MHPVAGMGLVDLYMESGEFAAAAWMADRLLQFQPNLTVERPRVLYRAALAYHLGGDESKTRERLGELKTAHAQATGVVRGVDVNLAESLAKELAIAPPAARAATADSWP